MFFLLPGLLLLIYVLYYRRCTVGVPEIYCYDEQRKKALRKHCPTLFKPFYPTIWATQAHFQTIGRSLLQNYPSLTTRNREKVIMSDGGHVCLDWYNEYDSDWYTEYKSAQPTVIILPGLTGSSNENYIQHWVDDVSGLNYRCVVYNYRGCGQSKLSNTKMYCGANVDDFVEILEHVYSKYPKAPLLAVGVSLGSTQLVRYVSECKTQGRKCRLKAVMLVSSLWNIIESEVNLCKFENRVTFNQLLASSYTQIMKDNEHIFRTAEKEGSLQFDYDNAIKSKYLYDVAERVMLPMFGYEDVDSYLEDWSPCRYIDGLTIPFLVVNALDDPFCPVSSLPLKETQENPNLMIAITRRGGHFGYMQGLLPFKKTWLDQVLVQFVTTIFEHDAL